MLIFSNKPGSLCLKNVGQAAIRNMRAQRNGEQKEQGRFETEREELGDEGHAVSTEINFRHDTSPGNFSADLINTRAGLFFDAEDLITFLRQLVNHLVEAAATEASFLPSHKIKISEAVCEKRERNTCCAEEKTQKLVVPLGPFHR